MPSDPDPHHALTIAQLAAESGVNAGTLRMWESRYGFPVPARTDSGHRRYRPGDAEVVRRVLRDRDAGMSLPLAIRRASQQDHPGDILFSGLRRLRPDIHPHVLGKRAMLALSRAIEDECCAQAESPLLYAAFQEERFFRPLERRWRELSRTAEVSIVFADFPEVRAPAGGPIEVPIEPTSATRREWSVVCDAPRYGACLVGWERPQARSVPDASRSFEAIWSIEPDVVRAAARLCNEQARWAAEKPARRADARLVEAPAAIGAEQLRVASALTSRMAAYLSSS